MAPTHSLKLKNGSKTDDLKIHMQVNGVIENNGSGQITLNVADTTKTINFRGTIRSFDVKRGAGSASINGEAFRFQDLPGYDTRTGVSDSSESEDKGIVEEVVDSVTGDDSDESASSGGSGRDTSGSTSVPVSSGGSLDNARPGLGCVARPMYTQGDIEMHVGDGCEYDSLQAAFNDIPHYVQHEVRIFVHGRTNDGNSAHIHSVSMANHVDFIVDGSDGGVIGGGGVNVGIDGKLDHIQFDSLKFEHISQCKDARFVNCDMNGNGTAAFSGKMGGKMLINCDIGSGNDDYAVFSIGNEMCELRNCTLRGNTAAIKAIGASAHALTGNNNIKAPKKMAGGASDVFLGGERSN